MKKSREKLLITVLIIIVTLISISVFSYAYFTAIIQGAEDETTITVTGGTLNIVFDGGNSIIANSVTPREEAVIVKTFTVTGNNTTNSVMPYNLDLIVDENSFSSGALTYTLESINTANSGVVVPNIINQKPISAGRGVYYLGNGSFVKGTNKTHTYILRIYFPETGVNQNIDQGKEFQAHIGITGEKALEGETINQEFNEYIIGLEKNSLTTGVYNEPDTDYRYEGREVNNYVSFNNELWRIIGLFDDYTHGIADEILVKIIRDDFLGEYQWDNNNLNRWGTSSLYTYLNQEYYNENILASYRTMIENVTWKLGGTSGVLSAYAVYLDERSAQTVNNNPLSYSGYIGLLYVSDYGYSVPDALCRRSYELALYYQEECKGNAWLYQDEREWTMMQYTSSPNITWHLNKGLVEASSSFEAKAQMNIRPTLYLKNSVKVISGAGAKENPYILGI